jgi:hypothetical protein
MSENPTQRNPLSDEAPHQPIPAPGAQGSWDELNSTDYEPVEATVEQRTLVLPPAGRRPWPRFYARRRASAQDDPAAPPPERSPWIVRSALAALSACLLLTVVLVVSDHPGRATAPPRVSSPRCAARPRAETRMRSQPPRWLPARHLRRPSRSSIQRRRSPVSLHPATPTDGAPRPRSVPDAQISPPAAQHTGAESAAVAGEEQERGGPFSP